jgi:hypothetical protein
MQLGNGVIVKHLKYERKNKTTHEFRYLMAGETSIRHDLCTKQSNIEYLKRKFVTLTGYLTEVMST